jgi:hypothetical protein
MTVENAYRLLNLKGPCSIEDVNKSFKTLAKIHHPDKGGSEKNFKILLEAKETLLKRGNISFSSNGRTYPNSQYDQAVDEAIKKWAREARESLEKLEKEAELRAKLSKIKIATVLSYIFLNFLSPNIIFWGGITLLFLVAMSKTESIYNLYLKFKKK